MDTIETFDAALQRLNDTPARPAAPGGVKPKLAVVSTYDELCGIAAYTLFLRKQLDKDYDVTVFELDQYLLRNPFARVRKLADQHIKDICAKLGGFDCVNLQLEHGTLGRDGKDILRRFKWLMNAAPSVSVTFHTVVPLEPLNRRAFWTKLLTLRWLSARKMLFDAKQRNLMSAGIYRVLRATERAKQVSIIVHNRREMRFMKYVNRFKNVFDHPLAFIAPEDAKAIRAGARRDRFPQLDGLPPKTKLVCVFGFFGRYKGFDTAIRALHHLPDDYHLLIFGGVHPNEIKKEEGVYPYVQELLDAAYIDKAPVDELKDGISLSIDGSSRDMLFTHPKDLSKRVHFMGALGDDDFLAGMAIADTVVFPYLEVGQSASGPISQAVELGCRVVASRTQTFMQFSRYHADTIEFFEIGNYVDLASRIRSRPVFPPEQRQPKYTTDTNRAVYRAANTVDVTARSR